MSKYIYIEDLFPSDIALDMIRISKRAGFMLRWVRIAPCPTGRSVSFTIFDLVKEGIFDVMPRTKRTPKQAKVGEPAGPKTGQFTPIVWANVRFSDDDLAVLSEQTPTNEVLGAMLLGVAVRGYGFSVKRMDDGQSYMCAIMGPIEGDTTRQGGVSSFADNPSDAALAALYKFEQLLGGVFTPDSFDAATSRPRFR